jgi:hypothetical protein
MKAKRKDATSLPTFPVIDLNVWHHAIHQVTGDMAFHFNRATPADLQRWAKKLRTVADEMESASNCTNL